MSTRKKKGRVDVGYGYVGKWADGHLGWFMPEHLTGAYVRDVPAVTDWNEGERGVLCRITVEELPGKRGRIMRQKKGGK